MRKLPQIKELREEVEECKLCPLHKTATHAVVDSGPLDAQLMLIGEAPGAAEDETGKPFQGKSGKLLDWALDRAGLDRKKVYIANVLKHRPPDNKIPEGEKGEQMVSACRPYLIRQISILRPRVVVVLGSLAAKTILATNGASMGSLVGGEFRQYDDTVVVATWHPSYVLRKGNKKELVRHLKIAARLLRDEE